MVRFESPLTTLVAMDELRTPAAPIYRLLRSYQLEPNPVVPFESALPMFVMLIKFDPRLRNELAAPRSTMTVLEPPNCWKYRVRSPRAKLGFAASADEVLSTKPAAADSMAVRIDFCFMCFGLVSAVWDSLPILNGKAVPDSLRNWFFGVWI